MGFMANDSKSMEVNEENADKVNEGEIEDLEWSPDQEILLLYSLNGYKPVGPVKFFNMFVIQERLSNAMNKQISSKAIWKKLNTMYDLEALDEAEAELSALEKVEVDFALPESEFGELMNAKLSGKELTIKVENEEEDDLNENEAMVTLTEIKTDPDTIEGNDKDTTDTPKRMGGERGSKKETVKRGAKKKDSLTMKDTVPSKKENVKETNKKDSPTKSEVNKEVKKGILKEEDKKEPVKKTTQELKKDMVKEDKKETPVKGNKRESIAKLSAEQVKKDLELKKPDQKKTPNQRGGTNQPRSETPKQQTVDIKRSDAKNLRSETPKPQRVDAATKQQRQDALRKDANSDKKKELPDKTERKSPESVRGSKLRAREKKTTELETTVGTKRERLKDSVSEEPTAKKAKIVITKGRPTRNSVEPQQKPTSPSPSPQKRRSRP